MSGRHTKEKWRLLKAAIITEYRIEEEVKSSKKKFRKKICERITFLKNCKTKHTKEKSYYTSFG